MTGPDLALVALAVLAGAATQRVTGLGFALVSAPFLVLVAGPVQGVLLANLLSLVVNLLVLMQTWRAVEPRRVVLLVLPALAALPAGAWVASHLRAAVLSVLVGSLVSLALLAVVLSERVRLPAGPAGAVAAGGLSGFMNVTAGVGGPAMTLYAVSTSWAQAAFVGSMQLYFAILNAGSVVVKGTPDLALPLVLTAGSALVLGIVTGALLTRRVTSERARSWVVVLALLGAGATVVDGLLAW